MNYITSTIEYKTLRSKYNSIEEMIDAAFSKNEKDLLECLKNELMDLEVSKSKRLYIANQFNNDLSCCAYYRLKNETLKYRTDNYKNLDQFNIDGEYSSVIKLSKELITRDVPLPNCFISLFKNKISKSYLDNKLKNLASTYHVDIESLDEECIKLPFLSSLKEIIEDGGNEELVEKSFIAILKIIETYKFLTSNGKCSVKIFEGMAKMLYRDHFFTNTANGERVATKKEKDKMLAGVFNRKTHLLNSENEKNVLVSAWVMTNNTKYYNRIDKFAKIADDKDKIKTYIDEIIKSMEYMVSSDFLEVDSKILLNTPEHSDYLDSADDEIVENMKIVDMVKLIKKELDPQYGDYYENLAWKIASECIRKKNYELSEKQLKVIENNYNKILRKKKESDGDTSTENNNIKTNNVYCEELVEKAKEVKKYIRKNIKNRNNNNYYKMVLDIIDKIMKNKFATEKQAAQVYNVYEKNIEDPLREMLKSVDAIEADDNDDKLDPPPLVTDISDIFVD